MTEQTESAPKTKKVNTGWTAVVKKHQSPSGQVEVIEGKPIETVDIVQALTKNDLRPLLKDPSIAEVLYIFKGKPVLFQETRKIEF
jgi:hypothetical protein